MSENSQSSWISRKLLPNGTEPDPRFSLANERTFLAWTRTSLAFIAGGVALEAFTANTIVAPIRTWVSVSIIIIGLLIAIGAGFRWLRVERNLREKKPLPVPAIIPLLSLGASVAAVSLVLVLLI